MPVSDLHRRMQYYSAYYLSNYTDIVGLEISGEKFGIPSVYDVMGLDINKNNLWSIEVKRSKEDFTRDEKLLVDSGTYLEEVNFCFLCCPANVIKLDDVPAPIGLLYYYRDMVPIKYIKRNVNTEDIVSRKYTHITKSKYYDLIKKSEWEKEADNRFIKRINNFEISYIIRNIFSVDGIKEIDEVCTPVIKVVREATYMDNSFCDKRMDLLQLVKQIGNKNTKEFLDKTVDMDKLKCYNIDEEFNF